MGINATEGGDTERSAADRTRLLRTGFQGTYRDHADAVYSVARGWCGGKVAADITNEVFVQLWRHPERHGPTRESMRTSLLKATHDIAVDTIGAQARRQSLASQVRPNADADRPDPAPASNDERSPAARPLDALSSEEREVIVTVTHGGCTYRQAAVVLGLDERTVKRRISEGLRFLRAAPSDLTAATREAIDERVDVRHASAPDHGGGRALDAREVVAQAQGIIMEREGCSSSEAYTELLQLSERLGMTVPACAEVEVTSARDKTLDPALNRRRSGDGR